MSTLADVEPLLRELNGITDLMNALAVASKDIVIATGLLVLIREQRRERHNNLKDMWLRAWDCGGALEHWAKTVRRQAKQRSAPAPMPDDVGDAGRLRRPRSEHRGTSSGAIALAS
jgi:hypothetical protein